MKKLKSFLPVALFSIFILFNSCGTGINGSGKYIPRTGKVKVKPVDDINRNFIYCRYEVTGPPSQGSAGIKTGEFICLKCPANKAGCDDFSEIELGDGQVYPVKAKDKGLACTSCPKGVDSPAGYPFEEE